MRSPNIRGLMFWAVLRRCITTVGLFAAIIVSAQTNEVSKLNTMKIKNIESWKDINIKLVTPSLDTTLEAKAKRAVYELLPKPTNGVAAVSILRIQDPQSKKSVFIDGEHSFYISKPSGMKGYTVGPGVLVWSDSYFEVSGSNRSNADIEEFERTVDARKLLVAFEKRIKENRIIFRHAVPVFYFSDIPEAGGQVLNPTVDGINLTDNTLRLDITNPQTKKAATIWINLDSKIVIKSIVDSHEMDVSDITRPFAVPLKSKTK